MSHPESVGPYRIVDVLGTGGMGVVYTAEDTRLGRLVALKTLGAGQDPDARDRLWREARSAASISHPGICQVYDVEVEDGKLWVAMELLEGEGLDARLRRDRPGVEEAIGIAIDVLGPLGALHSRGLIHRDLKPSNIFLTPHGTKILDFGLTRPADVPSDTRLTQTGAIVGTPHYMAPEQWRTDRVGPQSDLFSLGAILYEMLAGDYAFPGDDAIAVFHACAFEQPPPLTGARGIEAVDAAIRRAIAKDPAERPATAAELVSELEAARERMRVLRTDPGDRTPPVRRAETMRRFIALPFRMLRPDPDLEFLATSLPEAIGGSLSGLAHLVVRSGRLASQAHGADGGLDLKKLAAEAEVDYALAGTLMSGGSRLRLSAELLQVPAGTVVWSLREDVDVGDLFQVQDELAARVLEGIALPLSGEERARIGRDHSVSPRAYELYLRALHGSDAVRSASDLFRLRDLLSESIQEDPGFAPAHALYARACRVIAKYDMGDVDEHLRLAGEAFAAAFEVNPESPPAHQFYTYYQLEELGDSRGAMLRLLERVREVSSSAELWAGLVPACRFLGLYRASLAAHARARALDPRIETSVHFTHLQLAEWDLAVAASPRMDPVFAGLPLALRGREDEALAVVDETRDQGFEGASKLFVGSVVDAIRGRREAAERHVREAVGMGLRDPEAMFFFARVAGRVGATDLGLDLIERSIDRGYFCVAGLDRDPWVGRLAGHPRFEGARQRAAEGRRDAVRAFGEAGGEAILGVEESGEEI